MKTNFFKTSSFIYVLSILILVILFSSCAETVQVQECLKEEPYGFWGGLIHGIIAPFSFIVSLFDKDTALYAVNNNGGWYDFGFVIGAGILFGGGCKAGKKRC
ncbi:MAG: hypothetical protein ACM3PT_11870 [Deltaproteobacteria bacterium]